MLVWGEIVIRNELLACKERPWNLASDNTAVINNILQAQLMLTWASLRYFGR